MRTIVAVPLLSACLACGVSEPGSLGPRDAVEAPLHDGRFLIRSAEDDSGTARRFLTAWDRETGQSCLVGRATTDEARAVYCLPAPFGNLYYLDPECSEPVVETSGPAEGWLNVYGSGPGAGPARLGPRVLDAEATRYQAGGRVGCVAAGTVGDSTYEIAESRPTEDFELGRLRDEDVDDRLRAIWLDRADAPSVLYYLVDRLADTTCRPESTEAGLRCGAEIGVANDMGLRNSTCEKLAVAEYGRISVARVPERGDDLYRFSPVPWGTPHGIEGPDGGCTVSEEGFGRMTLHLAEPYPVEAWPALAADEVAPARLVAPTGRLPGGERAEGVFGADPRIAFHDVERNEDCGPAMVQGELRCVPAAPAHVLSWKEVFHDRGCTQRAVAVQAEQSPPAAFTWTLEDSSVRQDGLRSVEVREVGPRASRGYEVSARSGRCTAVSGTLQFYELGEALAASALAPLRLVHE